MKSTNWMYLGAAVSTAFLIAVSASMGQAAMNQCQQKHSADTCHHQLYR